MKIPGHLVELSTDMIAAWPDRNRDEAASLVRELTLIEAGAKFKAAGDELGRALDNLGHAFKRPPRKDDET